MDQSFMKERKILPLVLSMSLPMVISMAVNALYNIVDSYFVAKLSEEAMTALALVYPIQNLITAIGVGIGIGINAGIAYYLGAKKQTTANQIATQGIALSVLHDLWVSDQHSARSADDLWNRIFPEDGRAGSSRCNRTWLGRNIGLLSVVLLQRQGDVKDTHERDAADKRDQCQNVPGGNPGNLKYGTAIPADLCIERNVSRIFPDVCGHFRYLF